MRHGHGIVLMLLKNHILPALRVQTCSLLTRQKADVGRAKEEPEKSCRTAAKEVFSRGMVVIMIIVRSCDNCEIVKKNSPHSPQNNNSVSTMNKAGVVGIPPLDTRRDYCLGENQLLFTGVLEMEGSKGKSTLLIIITTSSSTIATLGAACASTRESLVLLAWNVADLSPPRLQERCWATWFMCVSLSFSFSKQRFDAGIFVFSNLFYRYRRPTARGPSCCFNKDNLMWNK